MILYDFLCTKCNTVFEDLVKSGEESTQCPNCPYMAARLPSSPKMFTQIVPTTKTSKKLKAGYVHSHADRPKTPGKIQVQVP